jgi:hypothetical protein
MRVVIAGILLLLLGACSVQRFNAWLSTPEERAFAEQMVQVIQAGDMRRLVAVSDPDTMRDFTERLLKQVRGLTPAGPAKLMTVSSNTVTAGGQTRTFKTFNYELGAGQHWAILQIILHPAGEKIWLAGVYVQPVARSPSAAHAFSLKGKGAIHYLWLSAMLLTVLTSIAALVLILRTHGLKLKWLWAIGSLFGFVGFQLNWTTGDWGAWPISFYLFGAAAVQNGPLLPWVMTFAIPVVAIVFLVARTIGITAVRGTADQPEIGAP